MILKLFVCEGLFEKTRVYYKCKDKTKACEKSPKYVKRECLPDTLVCPDQMTSSR